MSRGLDAEFYGLSFNKKQTGSRTCLDLTNNKAQKHTRGNILEHDDLEQDDLTQDCKHNQNK